MLPAFRMNVPFTGSKYTTSARLSGTLGPNPTAFDWSQGPISKASLHPPLRQT